MSHCCPPNPVWHPHDQYLIPKQNHFKTTKHSTHRNWITWSCFLESILINRTVCDGSEGRWPTASRSLHPNITTSTLTVNNSVDTGGWPVRESAMASWNGLLSVSSLLTACEPVNMVGRDRWFFKFDILLPERVRSKSLRLKLKNQKPVYSFSYL